MPNIRSSADLRNNYNDISSYCHAYNEPVFITKNGKGDKLQEGLADVEAGNTRPFADVMADLRHRRERR
ncbi:antitoxin PHD [Gemmiger formicilis]|uniref:antitoxin PHD n=1 Tax=Gemmiger formicilis TaxID=745368 RepID=UPI001C03741A|nr:antitoxin PHD [Gemmiger formicilis]MBT9675272.1 antitoxin PHD [Gemmiger formicilis]